MDKQQTFAGLTWTEKKKATRRERFLAEMDRVILWVELKALIMAWHPTAGRGGPGRSLPMMLRIYFQNQWFDLSDPAAEDGLSDRSALRQPERPLIRR